MRTLALSLALVTILGLTSAFAATKTVDINRANFPDTAFLKYVKQFDLNNNGALEAAELRKVDWISLGRNTAIKRLKGIVDPDKQTGRVEALRKGTVTATSGGNKSTIKVIVK